MMPRDFARLACLLLTLLATSTIAGEADPPVSQAKIRDSVQRGLQIVQKAATQYPLHRSCFSCHHQTLPMLAMVKARAHGLAIEADLLHEQADFSVESFQEKIEEMTQGKGVGGAAMTVGYGLWGLALADWPRDEIAEAMVSYLLKTQTQDGHWGTSGRRPPLEESAITCTTLAVEGLSHYGDRDRNRSVEDAIAKAQTWLLSAHVKNQEDRNARLRGLLRLKAERPLVDQAMTVVLDAQRDDGGWPAREDLPSDAYATGQTLAGLEEAGFDVASKVYQRGLRFLLDSQCDDGSWKVETRVKPVQVYFDNGDPHGKHQFISIPATAWAVAALAVALKAEPLVQPFDLLIRGGTIVDGTGNPWFLGDVAVRGDRIVALGQVPTDAPTRRIIDARGLVVSPGFIDMHSHSDRPLLKDGNAQSKIRQGVTTEVLGEDSSGGPSKGKQAPGSFRRAGKTIEWTTLGGYLDALEGGGIATNVASYVGLGTLLDCVMGDVLDRPNTEQLEAVKVLLEEAMNDGAFGLSTMLAGPRELNVTTDDLVELCKVVRRHGGIYSSHLRNEGTTVLDAVNEAIAIGERAGVPVDIIHVKIAEQTLWGRMNEIVSLIDEARWRGVNIQANVYPYTRGNNDLVTILPPWAHEGGKSELLRRLKDPEDRRRMRDDIRNGRPGWYNHYTAVGGDWGRMLISANLSEANKRFQGMTMDRILAERGQGKAPVPDPIDQLFDFLAEEKGSISTIYAHHTEEDMNLALRQPWCSIGSDGSALAIEGPLRQGNPHPRSFGTFPRVLGVYVRDRHLLSLEDAVRKMTSLNAAKIGLVDRGLLRPGQFADITLFDAAKVIDKSTYLEPFQYAEGIEYVIVNGKPVLERGVHNGARPGHALRRSARTD
ncbi:amidohydrolase family protein [Singulisphaera acidiphila]|uniref:N-acyl-D-aspartate/D-glutamate deacylase n=1 Tax=Singulisphaera acidiphila (strain ATCC BAA-1392 / DSM 18658 / VKM B-2454 / MOB10) TaxID=886293 RepID=L0DLV3_SINAD|nr:amidohydrolase family protein [Singulisphaera acidiphila]AGA29800.1 N-acyl-D-aspartate/D-glutamate deacylase [Singulisphaera acidiphila DSM 18658]